MAKEFVITVVKNGFIVRENNVDHDGIPTRDTRVFNTHDDLFELLNGVVLEEDRGGDEILLCAIDPEDIGA